MDVTYEATPMVAEAEMTPATTAVQKVLYTPAIVAVSQVASLSCSIPSIAGTSISAVSPDFDSRKELALAGA